MIEAAKYRSYNRPQLVVEPDEGDEMARKKLFPLSRGKLRSSSGKHYWKVFLWSTQEDYESAAEVTRQGTLAVCMPETWVDKVDNDAIVRPKLGEIHFVSGTWGVNTVAHEIQHAILHRMRYMEPNPRKVLDELDPSYNVDDEEVIAYEAGDWIEATMAWLTNTDPASPYPVGLFDRES